MNRINILIRFMENAIESRDTDQFETFIDDEGRAIFLDNHNRIRVAVTVNKITVSQYSMDDGNLQHSTEILWDSLSLRQKTRIIDLLEDDGEIDPEINDTLGQIFG